MDQESSLHTRGVESRIGLYADDVLLYLGDPVVSVAYLLDLIRCFGKLSAYTIFYTTFS